MSARYWVMACDEFMDDQPNWPPTIRPVERGGIERPGWRWWLLEDDDAPADLDGKEVDLTFGTVEGLLMIERRVTGGLTDG